MMDNLNDLDDYDFKHTGVCAVRPGVIAWMEVREEADKSQEVYYRPTKDDVEKMCQAHGFDFKMTWNLIINRASDIHGFLFLGDKVRAYQKEQKREQRHT